MYLVRSVFEKREFSNSSKNIPGSVKTVVFISDFSDIFNLFNEILGIHVNQCLIFVVTILEPCFTQLGTVAYSDFPYKYRYRWQLSLYT